ncbi:hypothetical protein [Legionella hackeliae]|uniref:Uncharacterized protein n=1 Tax=Legionella hackeliae TaxID=449 RepID=A0A0A8UP33_LEGHA|nr:hypothetical protein [Legionella hackeliae]KTD13440.1 hypothetical protein Lhac_0824 [Legionella hackeliae]CEK09281.1 protein of unknown function [Legionella hackeliae]STX49188.1 Uncharacterised protein [Legionella hackeliae]
MKRKEEIEDTNLFEVLPNETINHIVDALKKESGAQRNFATSCRFFYKNYNDQWLINKLIEAVIICNQNKVQKILVNHPEYMFEKMNELKDLSGRTF